MLLSAGQDRPPDKPRLGFAGLGWMGGQRMQALADSGLAEIHAVCEPDGRRREIACESLACPPIVCGDFEELLELPLDGIVIATPNALHEPQTAAALQRDLPVFSQKPLALSRAGTVRLLDLASRRNLPLGVDWSYRFLKGMPELRRRIAAGELGRIHSVELQFHNAYGPDAAWYYQLSQAGGGCMLDLGCHLLDLCHWLLGARGPGAVRARCFRDGTPLKPPIAEAEDFVVAQIEYETGEHAHLSCSWRASVGRGALIGCKVFGSEGGAELRNIDGSFHDFEVAIHHGTETTVLGGPPDDWGGRALKHWTSRLRGGSHSAELDHLEQTALLIDMIYGRTGEEPRP